MDLTGLQEDFRRLLRMLEEKGYSGQFVVQGQYGIDAAENADYFLRQWEMLMPKDSEMLLTLTVQLDWTSISYVEYCFFLHCKPGSCFSASLMAVRKLGRMSGRELGAVHLEFEGLVKAPGRYQARTALEKQARLDNY